MSNIGLNFGDDEPGRHPEELPEGHLEDDAGDREDRRRERRRERRRDRRASRRRTPKGCLAALVVLLLLGAAAWFGGNWAVDELQARFADAPDYPGPGQGQVVVEVEQGASSAAIGRALKDAGVVKSVEAFTDAARVNPESRSIQVGFYSLKKEMKASDALEVLLDPANLVQTSVAIPEGLRVADIVDILARESDFGRARFERALRNPEALGLPDYAGGNAEGYLFPATYAFGPDAKPADMLKAMVDRWRQEAESLGLESRARALGYGPHELMTIASLVEAEGRGEDMPKIARVIYNRLENPGAAGTTGKLEIDATVNYALGRKLGVALSPEDLQVDSPYNTRRYPGLPPGPIESPGAKAIEAALRPAAGDWYYYVTVDLRTGETKFAESYDEFLRYKAEFQEYCQTSDAC